MPASLASREATWDALGKGAARGLGDLAVLVAVVGVLTFGAVLVGLALARWPR